MSNCDDLMELEVELKTLDFDGTRLDDLEDFRNSDDEDQDRPDWDMTDNDYF